MNKDSGAVTVNTGRSLSVRTTARRQRSQYLPATCSKGDARQIELRSQTADRTERQGRLKKRLPLLLRGSDRGKTMVSNEAAEGGEFSTLR